MTAIDRIEARISGVVVVVFSTAVAMLSLLCSSPAMATFAGNGGDVVLQSSRDGDNEIYTVPPFTGTVTQLTTNTAGDVDPAWSPDGSKIAFASTLDGDFEIWTMDADGTDQEQLTFNDDFDGLPAWSPDGLKIAFASDRDGDREIFTMSAIPGALDVAQLTHNAAADVDPAWGLVNVCPPSCVAEERIAFTSGRDGNEEIYVMEGNGASQTNLSSNLAADRMANWSPCANKPEIVFASDRDGNSEIYRMAATGGALTRITTDAAEDTAPVWSPNCQTIAFERVAGDSEIFSIRPPEFGPDTLHNWTNAPTNERRPDWQPSFDPPPAHFRYPRPAGATPLRASLVLAYAPCTTPDLTHGQPLSFGSCSSPQQTSANLTVGTPDANGAPAGSTGSVHLSVHPGVPGPPEDAGLIVQMTITDVRCRPGVATCGPANAAGGADYSGEVQLVMSIRMTDRWNAASPGGGTDSATGTDIELPVDRPCVTTPSTAVGSTCHIGLDANAIVPGVIKEAQRTIWQLDRLRVMDGGPDGDVATTPNDLFAVQGIFVP